MNYIHANLTVELLILETREITESKKEMPTLNFGTGRERSLFLDRILVLGSSTSPTGSQPESLKIRESVRRYCELKAPLQKKYPMSQDSLVLIPKLELLQQCGGVKESRLTTHEF